MICRIIGSGRGVSNLVDYITHDQTSPENPKPATSERVAWTACLGIPTDDTALMVRAMQGLTADAPALKERNKISAKGRKLKKPYSHVVLSWPEGAETPPKEEMLSAAAGALGALNLDDRHYAVCAAHDDTNCPHVHIAISRVDPETGRAVNLDKGAGKRVSRWAEEYERAHGGIVVPTRVERREAEEARNSLERQCRKNGMPPEEARSTAARMHPRPPARRASRKPPPPTRATPEETAKWAELASRQRNEVQRQQTAQTERVERRRHEWAAWQEARTKARAAGTDVPPKPRTPPVHTLRADAAQERAELRRTHRAERVSLARQLGRAIAKVWRHAGAAVRKLVRRSPQPKANDTEAERRHLDAKLATARQQRTEQTRERLAKEAKEAYDRYDQAYHDWSYGKDWTSRRASPERQAQVRALKDELEAAYDVHLRADEHLSRYKRAADAVRRGPHVLRTSYSPSLQQVMAAAKVTAAADLEVAAAQTPGGLREPRREAKPQPREPAPTPARIEPTRRPRPAPTSPRPDPSSRREAPPPPGPVPPSRAAGYADAQARADRDRDCADYSH